MTDKSFDALAEAKALNESLVQTTRNSQLNLNEWVRKTGASIEDTVRQHEQNMLKLSQEANEHQGLLSSLIVEKRRVTVEKEKENHEGNILQTDLSRIQARKANLDQEVEKIKTLQNEQTTLLVDKQSEIAHLTARNRGILDELQKSLTFYRKFGLNFEKLADRWLKLTFTLIDPSDHLREFYFLLFINSHDQYEVQECTPAVDALPSMLATLNATNDFSAFVVGMRRQFKSLV